MMLAVDVDTIGSFATVVAAFAALASIWFAWRSAVAGRDAAKAARATVQILELARRDSELNAAGAHIRETLGRFQRWAMEAETFHKRMAKTFTSVSVPGPSEIPNVDEELHGLDEEFRDLELETMIRDLHNWRRELLLDDEVVEAVRIAEQTSARAWSGVFKIVGNFTTKPSRITAFAASFTFNKRLNDPRPSSLLYISRFAGELATAVSRSQKRVTSPEPTLVGPDDRRDVHWLTVSDAGTWELHTLYKDRALGGFTQP
jgi:hypothetical protein